MPRPLGLPKTGGREKGTPNKRTEAFASKLSELNLDLLEEISNALPELAPERRVQALIALLPYRYSKANADIEIQIPENTLLELTDAELDARIEELTTKKRTEA